MTGGFILSELILDAAELRSPLSFFQNLYFMLCWLAEGTQGYILNGLTRAYSLVHSENEFVVAICNSLVLRDELVHEWRILRWRAFFRMFVSHSGY
jgi:hypothetical protein